MYLVVLNISSFAKVKLYCFSQHKTGAG